jgi:hypothetical protein
MSLRVLICWQSFVSRRPAPSMTGHCLLLSAVKRILLCLLMATLLGAACGSDRVGEISAASTDASTDSSSSTVDDVTPDTGSEVADDVAESEESVNGESVSDTAGIDWPLSYDGKTVDGSHFNSGDYAGQDLVLWFWAPW